MMLHYKQESKYFAALNLNDLINFEKSCNPDDLTISCKSRVLRVIFYSIQEKQAQLSVLNNLLNSPILTRFIKLSLQKIEKGLLEENKELHTLKDFYCNIIQFDDVEENHA